MISDKDGTISFVPELTDTIHTFLQEYEEREGPLSGDLERGLVISYALGVMRCDLENVWKTLGEAKAFQRLHPRDLFEECAEQEWEGRTEQRAVIKEALQESPSQIDFD